MQVDPKEENNSNGSVNSIGSNDSFGFDEPRDTLVPGTATASAGISNKHSATDFS